MHNQFMFSLDFKLNDLTSYNGYQLFYDNSSRKKKDLMLPSILTQSSCTRTLTRAVKAVVCVVSAI